MVERRISDGRRLGQLLASELTGLSVGVLADVSVTDADPDARPSESGTEAYRIAFEGTVVASVRLYPEHATVCLRGERAWPDDVRPSETEPTRPSETEACTPASVLRVTDGAGVKRAVDALRDTLGEEPDGVGSVEE
jgi:hypothetical protein